MSDNRRVVFKVWPCDRKKCDPKIVLLLENVTQKFVLCDWKIVTQQNVTGKNVTKNIFFKNLNFWDYPQIVEKTSIPRYLGISVGLQSYYFLELTKVCIYENTYKGFLRGANPYN